MRVARPFVPLLLLLGLAAAPAAAGVAASPVVDGTLDASYGNALAAQAIQTQFGDANVGAVDAANGSELDGFYAFGEDSVLYLFLTGNLESNFNKLELFFDTKPGGQNVLRGDNANVDFDGLNAMAGLTFDAGFAADYYITVAGGGSPYQLFASWAELPDGGNGAGAYLGQTGAASDGTLTGGAGTPGDLRVTVNNGNTAGVNAGCAPVLVGVVDRGVELRLRLPLVGYPGGGDVRVCAFVNGSGHDFVSNQVLGPLPAGTCNLGDPATVDFSAIAGDQFVTINEAVPARPTSWGRLKAIYR